MAKPENQSELLTRFYDEYLAWVNAGIPEHPVFDPCYGLCSQLWDWVMHYFSGDERQAGKCENEQCNMFTEAKLNVTYPFNTGTYSYEADSDSAAMHLNERRMKWVKEHSSNG